MLVVRPPTPVPPPSTRLRFIFNPFWSLCSLLLLDLLLPYISTILWRCICLWFWPETNGKRPRAANKTRLTDWWLWLLAIIYHRYQPASQPASGPLFGSCQWQREKQQIQQLHLKKNKIVWKVNLPPKAPLFKTWSSKLNNRIFV